MRLVRSISYCALVSLACGCPGTLDEQSFYRGEYAPASTRDGGAASELDPDETEDALDAGIASRDAGTRDALAQASAAPWVSGGASPMDASPADGWVADSADGASSDGSIGPDAASGQRDAGAAAPPDASGSCDFRALIAAKCGNAGCHGAPAVATGLDLTSDNLAARLQGKQATSSCSTYLLIDVDNPARSALYLKVTKDACGSRMPLGGTLTDQEQSCILQWIENL